MVLPKKFFKIGPVSLIDILVVWVIFGAALVAALALINPLERLRIKQDAVTFASTQALSHSLSEYYAKFGGFPWKKTAADNAAPLLPQKPQQSWLKELSAQNLLSSELVYQTNLKEYLVVNSEARKVCFYPASAKYRALGTYDEGGVNNCLPQGVTPCFICFEY